MNILNTKKLSKEQIEIFELLQKDREENANVLEKPSMGGVKRSVIEKYSEHAHFIYELLQNADDTNATNVRFVLNKSGLFFAHNGEIHFSISHPHTEDADKKSRKLGHINSITSIGNTTKLESQIGKFGVGFKAVFEYTNTPHVYDPPFLFKIERFIIPVLLENDHPNRMDGETLFYFPFDLENKKDPTYKEINEKLKILDNPLLFLRHLKNIKWKNEEGESGFYSNEFEHKFLIFEKKVKDQEQFERAINIAYKYDPKGEKISSDHKFPAYCFFRTRENTELRFIVHAPFLLTDSREGIKEDAWNDFLIKELAELAGDSLPEIREMGLLDVGFFNVLSIIKDDFKDSKFQPIYDAVLKKLRSEEKLLPANDGDHISTKQAFLARGKELIELLGIEQLSFLFEKENCQWLDSNITQDRMPVLRKYLIEDVGIEEITPEKLASKFTEEFIKEQSDEWIIKFYTFLKNRRNLWGESYHNAPLRSKPFIRRENNAHVVPFDDSGKPLVYLPVNYESSFPTAKKSIAENKEAREFLKELGLNEPDKYDEIVEYILPKYKEKADISDYENIDDVKRIIEVLKIVIPNKKQNLIDELKNIHFLKAANPVKQEKCFCTPCIHSIYLTKRYSGNEILETYFKGNPDIYFLDDIYKDFKKEDLLELGCLDKVRVKQRESNRYDGNVTIDNRHSNHKRGLDGFDPDCEIEGVEYALKNINKGRSIVIWNLLKQNYRSIYGVTESSSRQDYSYSKKEDMASKMGKLVREAEWLPDKYGNFRKPSDILLSDLLDDFDKESTEAKILAEKLGFKKDIEQEYLSQISEEDRKRIELSKKIPLGILEKLVAEEKDHERFPVQPVNDEERRKSKAIENYKGSPNKEYTKKDRSVRISQEQTDKRIFLREWYQNEEGKVICQICKSPSSFKNRQDKHYFEAVEIVADEKEYDRNALALCPLCAAKYLNGERTEDEKIKERLHELYLKRKMMQRFVITIDLCGEQKQIQFAEKHLVDLLPIFEKTQ